MRSPDDSQDSTDVGLEALTRGTYSAWMKQGLLVIEQLLDKPARDGVPVPRWSPPPEITLPNQPIFWGARPAPFGALPTAKEKGWLVTGPPPRNSQHGRLDGLTVAVKDVIDVAGLPTRNGTPGALWRDRPASAPVWESLTIQGAQCVGKAATHEMAWGVTTPQIANPHDRHRIAGGSSGGSAASVSIGASQAALGTDTGGSIRIPAALCGVVGFRPTAGALNMSGITNLAPSQDVVGPIAADVATCIATLEVMTSRTLSSVRDMVHGMRIGVLARPGRLQTPVDRGYRNILTQLKKLGATLVECETTAPRQATSVSLVTMLHESARIHAAAVHQNPRGFSGQARALLTLGEDLEEHSAAIELARRAVTEDTARLFSDEVLDAFLTPTTPCTAPLLGAETVEIAGRSEPVSSALTRFTAWASVAAMPAISIPVPSRDLPVAVQVMAPPHREDVCAELAMAIEQFS